MQTTFLLHLHNSLALDYHLPAIPQTDESRGRAWFLLCAARKARRR